MVSSTIPWGCLLRNEQPESAVCASKVSVFCVFQELWTAAWDALGTNSVVDDLQHAAVTAGPHARGHPPFVTKGEKLTIIMFYLQYNFCLLYFLVSEALSNNNNNSYYYASHAKKIKNRKRTTL